MNGHYPNTRLRRTRAHGWSRALHRENLVTPADLIWPLFVTAGEGVEEPIATLPGVSRWSVDGIVKRAKEAVDLASRWSRCSPTPRASCARTTGPRRIIPTT